MSKSQLEITELLIRNTNEDEDCVHVHSEDNEKKEDCFSIYFDSVDRDIIMKAWKPNPKKNIQRIIVDMLYRNLT